MLEAFFPNKSGIVPAFFPSSTDHYSPLLPIIILGGWQRIGSQQSAARPASVRPTAPRVLHTKPRRANRATTLDGFRSSAIAPALPSRKWGRGVGQPSLIKLSAYDRTASMSPDSAAILIRSRDFSFAVFRAATFARSSGERRYASFSRSDSRQVPGPRSARWPQAYLELASEIYLIHESSAAAVLRFYPIVATSRLT